MRNHETITERKSRLAHVLPAIVAMPFYRKKYQIENLSDEEAMDYIVGHFYELPLMTREEAQQLTATLKEDGRISRCMLTGGTCGMANIVEWCDADVSLTTRRLEERLQSYGIKAGDGVFSTIPGCLSIYGQIVEMVCIDSGLTLVSNERIFDANIKIAMALLTKYQPKFMVSTAATLLDLIENPKMLNALSSIEIVAIGGAITSRKDIEKIEQTMHCHVLNLIGSTEMGLYGIQDHGCDTFHLIDSVIMEVIDCDEHGIGNCVATSLCNRRMPLVRYINGDRGYLPAKCSCGYEEDTYTITGRIADTCYIGGTKIDTDCFQHLTESLGMNTTFQALIFNKEKRIQLNVVDERKAWSMQNVVNDLFTTNIALYSKIAEGLVRFDIHFIKESELIGLSPLGKWHRILAQ